MVVLKLLLELLNAFNAIVDAGERGIQFRAWLRKRSPVARLGIRILIIGLMLTGGLALRLTLWHRTETVPVLPGVVATRPQSTEGSASEGTKSTAAPQTEVLPTRAEQPRVSEVRPEAAPLVTPRPQTIYQEPVQQTGASETVYALLSEGKSLHDNGDYREAGRIYRNALAQVPAGSSVEADRLRAELVDLIRDARSGCESDPEASC